LAKREQHELSQDAVNRIMRVVRSLADDRVDRGVDLNRTMRCDSCGQEKSPQGAAQYGAYQLCNDCLLDFTLALASNQVGNVAEYMTRKEEGGVDASVYESGQVRDRSPVMRGSLHVRDTLMPSNEPC
jgi:hypothetical protein